MDPTAFATDRRALRILFNTFWSPSGWKDRSQQGLPADDLAYAKSKGVMFDPVHFGHTDGIVRLRRLVEQISPRQVADAFLVSLSSRRLDWRSALGSYAVFQHLQPHSAEGAMTQCPECGYYLENTEHDFNILSFERQKWGGVRHDRVEYAILDLESFLGSRIPNPTQHDFALFQDLIGAIATVKTTVTSAALHSHFSSVIKSNKAERDVIVAILGFCGILGTPEHPGYSDKFVSPKRRILPARHFVDMSYPACWWNGGVGVNREMLRKYFGHAL